MRFPDVSRRRGWVRVAVAQGITAPLIYLGVTVIGGALRPGYDHFTQAVSELTEAGAVNKPGLDMALGLMELLTIAFGVGYYVVVRRLDRRLAASALLIVAIGLVGLGFARFPMDPMGSPMTPDGRMHLVIVTLSALGAIAAVVLAGIGWRRVPGGRRMALGAFAALAVMLGAGVMSGVAMAQGWPGIGLWERLNIAAFGFWQIATAVVLLRPDAGPSPR